MAANVVTLATEATNNQKLTNTLTAPIKETMLKVRMPAKVMFAFASLLRSRSAPIKRPIPKATAKFSQGALSINKLSIVQFTVSHALQTIK